jgi:hypothetical protein
MELGCRAMVQAIGRTAEEGVRNYIWAALMDTPGGAYVSDCRVEEWVEAPSVSRLPYAHILWYSTPPRPSRFVISTEGKDAEDRVWNELVEIWYSIDSKIGDIIA